MTNEAETVNKTNRNFSLFDYPEISELFSLLFDRIFTESGRGALLIATSHAEDHLANLIKEVLPIDFSKKQTDKLFNYPGALSSFSAKIELAYAFRIIDKTLYDCLNALRKIRNDAAHSSAKFELHELNEKMKEVYTLGPSIPYFIKDVSSRAVWEQKFDGLKKIFDKFDLSDEDRKQQVESIINDKEKIVMLEKQVPYWELIYGMCFLCAMIAHQREEISTIMKNRGTLGRLININSKLDESTLLITVR